MGQRMNITYAILTFLVSLYYRALYFVKVEGKENVPKEGGFLVCCNHKSNNDPVMLAVFTPRQLKFLAKKELFKKGICNWFLKNVGAIPLNRGASDVGAIKQCMSALKKGFGLLVFPQGTRCKEIDRKNFHGGSALIASRVGVPVVPAYISGEYKLFKKHKLVFGEAVPPEKLNEIIETSEDRAEAMGDLLYSSIKKLEEDEKNKY